VRAGTTYFLVVVRNGVRRCAVLAAACVAALLYLAPSAHALPLESDIPVPSSTSSLALERSAASSICVWSFLHPGVADQSDVSRQLAVTVPEVSSPAEPRWIADRSEENTADQSLESCELSDFASLGSTFGSTPVSYKVLRWLRSSGNNQRLTRVDTETYPATNVPPVVPPPPSLRCVEGIDDNRAEISSASRLFRPPRSAIRLP